MEEKEKNNPQRKIMLEYICSVSETRYVRVNPKQSRAQLMYTLSPVQSLSSCIQLMHRNEAAQLEPLPGNSLLSETWHK